MDLRILRTPRSLLGQALQGRRRSLAFLEEVLSACREQQVVRTAQAKRDGDDVDQGICCSYWLL